ncbi:MAG TPA: 2-oxo acid dehydrogenase subunit E2 [Cyclobacteriaceae bacterium]|nr:2-oxo acid dehydrogenase subunit E2 [Cyclobacteriaceae bacterium]
MTLSVDHRVVDGAVGAQFLTDLVRVIENPDMIIY